MYRLLQTMHALTIHQHVLYTLEHVYNYLGIYSLCPVYASERHVVAVLEQSVKCICICWFHVVNHKALRNPTEGTLVD